MNLYIYIFIYSAVKATARNILPLNVIQYKKNCIQIIQKDVVGMILNLKQHKTNKKKIPEVNFSFP